MEWGRTSARALRVRVCPEGSIGLFRLEAYLDGLRLNSMAIGYNEYVKHNNYF